MYSLINQHIDHLLSSINPKRDVEPYVWLRQTLPDVNVGTDTQFQQVYRKYWQLNPARLSVEFQAAYFGLLQQLKTAKTFSVDTVVRHLFPVPTNKKGRKSIQFSFASKLVHMLRPELPVYDSMITQFFFLDTAPTKKGSNKELQGFLDEKKLHRLLKSYDFLVAEYRRVLEQGLLAPAIQAFRARFQVGPDYSDPKVIDTVIWKFVSLLKKGAIRDGRVRYT